MFPGLDIADPQTYFLDLALNSNLRFVGFYLAHAAYGRALPWVSGSMWRDLRDSGWGLLPLWVPYNANPFAQEYPNLSPQPSTVPRNGQQVSVPSTTYDKAALKWNRAKGAEHGSIAAMVAKEAHIELSASIYLDLEAGILGWPNAQQYVEGWMAAIVSAGYAPGVYCSHLSDVDTLLKEKLFKSFPTRVIWPFAPRFDGNGVSQARVEWTDWTAAVTGTLVPLVSEDWPLNKAATWGLSKQVVGCQHDWWKAGTGKGTTKNPTVDGLHWRGILMGAIDWDSARMPDPAFPLAASAIAGCRIPHLNEHVAVRLDVDSLSVFHQVNGSWDRVDVDQNDALTFPNCGPASTYTTPSQDPFSGFDPAGAAVVSRQMGYLDIFVIGQDGTVRTFWEGVAHFPKHDWVVNPASMRARKGSPIEGISGREGEIDIFYVDSARRIVHQWWTPSAVDWKTNAELLPHDHLIAPSSNIMLIQGAPLSAASNQVEVAFVAFDAPTFPYKDTKLSDQWFSVGVIRGTFLGASRPFRWTYDTVPDTVGTAPASGVSGVRIADGTTYIVVQSRDRMKLLLRARVGGSWTNEPDLVLPLTRGGVASKWWTIFRMIAIGNTIALVGVLNDGTVKCYTFSSGTWKASDDILSALPVAVFAPYHTICLLPYGNLGFDLLGVSPFGEALWSRYRLEKNTLLRITTPVPM